MSQVIKAFTGVFFLMLLTLLGSGIVSAQLDSAYARDYKEAVVAEIENSGFCESVMNACITQAREDGYELTMTVYQSGEKPIVVGSKVDGDIMAENVEMVEILLNYDYSIPFLNYMSRHTLRGYAG